MVDHPLVPESLDKLLSFDPQSEVLDLGKVELDVIAYKEVVVIFCALHIIDNVPVDRRQPGTLAEVIQ